MCNDSPEWVPVPEFEMLDGDQCEMPCDYGDRCSVCEPFWEDMINGGYYVIGSGWTDKAIGGS